MRFRLLDVAACVWAAALLASTALAQESQRQYLSGRGKDDAVPWRFLCTAGPQSGYWTNLPVPSNWELHGFGTLSYMREPTNAFAEQGCYECDFRVPSEWSARRLFLVFDGVMTDTHAEVNGQQAGPDHQGGFYRFKCEITRLLRFNASNRLEVLVHKRSANVSVNKAERAGDYWNFGGIFRPVYLEAVPAQFIERVAIDARADGAFTMDIFANGAMQAAAGLSLEAHISSLDGSLAAPVFQGELSGNHARLKAKAISPRCWTAETPVLYRVEVRLKRGTEVLHRFWQRFGFRTMEVRESDGLYVNGHRVILKGADRHSAWPDAGRCLSEAVHRLDINSMKDMNMNAVRMSHYPPDEQFLDLCDELGLYVLDELAGWHQHYDTPTGRRLIEAMVTRDVNHPCILFWDNGNEDGWNTELDGDFARWDPQQRRVLHPWATINGVNTAHYLGYERAKFACEGTPISKQGNQATEGRTNEARSIYMPTEFLHGLYDGGAGAGMEDYWNLMRQSKYLGGGFVWALLDEGIKRPETGKMDVSGNLAPDGILGPYRQREASFYTIKEVWSPIVVSCANLSKAGPGAADLIERPTAGTRDLVFEVENRYSFTEANQCAYSWQLRKFSQPAESSAGFSVVAEGEAKAPSIQPGGRGNLTVPLRSDVEADALALRVTDPTGRELWTWVWPMGGSIDFSKQSEAPSSSKATISESPDAIAVQVGDSTVFISKRTGLLAGVERKGQTFSLTNGPRPAVGNTTLRSLEHDAEGQDYVVRANFDGSMQSVVWRIRSNGWLECSYTYIANGPQDFHGVAFDYSEPLVKKKKWLGDGPYRVWKNRLRGVRLGVWENDYNDTITGWRGWVYPEFKGCFANVRWLRLETAEGAIMAVPGRGDQFVQVLTPEFPPMELQAKTAVSLPSAGLAFLQAIPPIGNKFRPAKDGGPQGQPNMATGLYSGSVSFCFDPSHSSEEAPAGRKALAK
jgi:hypothetical protein